MVHYKRCSVGIDSWWSYWRLMMVYHGLWWSTRHSQLTTNTNPALVQLRLYTAVAAKQRLGQPVGIKFEPKWAEPTAVGTNLFGQRFGGHPHGSQLWPNASKLTECLLGKASILGVDLSNGSFQLPRNCTHCCTIQSWKQRGKSGLLEMVVHDESRWLESWLMMVKIQL